MKTTPPSEPTEEGLEKPVLLLIFNRPLLVRAMLERLRAVRPRHLYVVADGPRPGVPDDVIHCSQARRELEAIDWPCEVRRLERSENRGGREGVVEGLNWLFAQVNEAIILEDDCLPEVSFFQFCTELLDRYREEPRIGLISGTYYLRERRVTEASYYFSRHTHIWGWATWRRAWAQHDPTMAQWPQVRPTRWLRDYVQDATAAHYWKHLFDDTYDQKSSSLQSWAIAWVFTCWRHRMLSIIPARNLVTNVGFDVGATRTTRATDFATYPQEAISFPLRHPIKIAADAQIDLLTEEAFYYGESWAQRLFWKARLPLSVRWARRIYGWANILRKAFQASVRPRSV
jgi:hypothetical protein